MNKLKFIQVCSNVSYYVWQVGLWLESLKKLGLSNKAVNLIYLENENSGLWNSLISLYPESEFVFYKNGSEYNVSKLIFNYIPVIRPYCLYRYYSDFPEMENYSIFYCDCDILFTDKFNLENLLEKKDSKCYVSNTNSYINADYFDSKLKDVLEHKKEEYLKIDVLSTLTKSIGISKAIAEKNNLHSGGAQYLLKNINAAFWKKVMNDCITIRTYLQAINSEFFENENNGFQSWCADMWAVLWNLWYTNKEVEVIDQLNFAWPHEPIYKLNNCTILHNAGVSSSFENGYNIFYKGKYINGNLPTVEELNVVLKDETSKTKCTWYYTNELKKMLYGDK